MPQPVYDPQIPDELREKLRRRLNANRRVEAQEGEADSDGNE